MYPASFGYYALFLGILFIIWPAPAQKYSPKASWWRMDRLLPSMWSLFPPSTTKKPSDSYEWSVSLRVDSILAALMTASLALAIRKHLRRYFNWIMHLCRYGKASHVPLEDIQQKRILYGYISQVSDADGVRFRHLPWSWWMFSRVLPQSIKQNPMIYIFNGRQKEETLSVRLAGVDAPEMGHFGQPAQPFAQEAFDSLKSSFTERPARLKLLRLDQYGRIVGLVESRRRWYSLRWTDLSMYLLERGHAVVYRSNGADYAGRKLFYEQAEAKAKYSLCTPLTLSSSVVGPKS